MNKSEDTDKLVLRVKEGLTSSKYKPVDYEHLKSLTAQKKISANRSLLKVKKIEEASKSGKEHNVLKQHKLVWQKEFLRLTTSRKKVQIEIDALVHQNINGVVCPQTFVDFEEYDTALLGNFNQFKIDTVDPIWQLRDDLQYWVQAHLPGSEEARTHCRNVQETVDHVKQQQLKILEWLKNQQTSLEQELQSEILQDAGLHGDRLPPTGIPQETFDLECPDDHLKVSVLQEFILLDEKYLERLNDVESQHQMALRSNNAGWTDEDHFVFLYVTEQYPYDLPKRRMLVLDRLKRHLPHKSRAQLVEHDEWWTYYRYYLERRKAIIHDWSRDRRELLNKAKAVFIDACLAHEFEAIQAEHREKQQGICDTLYEKVQLWREQKVKLMWLEQQKERRQRAERMELLKAEQEEEKQRRCSEKEKIKVFLNEKEKKQKVREEKEQRRLEELKRLLAEQAEYDQQRVKFREEQIREMNESVKQRKMEEQLLLEEKERRLESLRETVRPYVEADPERVHYDTLAWKSHVTGDEEVNLQKPLFQINTFNSKQVTADPRVRLEGKLREAGLHNTDYARLMLAQMKPAQPPRRDMESTVFKS